MTNKKQRKDEIIKLVQTIMGNGTMVVETINEAVLVKLMELNGTPIKFEKTYRNIEKDWKMYQGDQLKNDK